MQQYYLKLIHFNQKNTGKTVKTFSRTAHNEMIELYFTRYKISMQVGTVL